MPTSRSRVRRNKNERTLIVDQWVEITVVGGVTRTMKYPDDQGLTADIALRAQQAGRPVELVYRRLNFVDGIPREYEWATDDPQLRKFGGRAIQRLRVVDWLNQLQIETDGHILDCEFTMPRPESRGGCDCDACQSFTNRIETQGY